MRVLVAGDLMLDHFVWGRVDRISPEAPVPVVKLEREEDRLGGAANVVGNLAALGCAVSICGVVGADESGRVLRRLLEERHIDTGGIVVDEARPTTEKRRVMAQHQQMLRCDRERTDPIAGEPAARVLAHLERALGDFDGLVLSDYEKGLLTPALLSRLIGLCRDAGKAVIIDPKGQDYAKYRGATAITPNQHEAATAARSAIVSEEDALRVAGSLLKALRLDGICITLGARGVLGMTADGQQRHFAASARDVFDVTGAGDTFLSAFGALVIGGQPFFTAVELANLAAGLAVGKLGTSVVSAPELLRAAQGAGAVYTREELAVLAAQLRAQGKRIVFTNGCFDLLHAGHIQYLQASRAQGDVLIVGINSDASVRRLKGPSRPVIGELDRAHLLAALSCVDYVVPFDEDTPEALIRAIRPDVLTKGADYTVETVVGHELVGAWGGRVHLVPLRENASTSGLIEKIVAGRKG
ncbi:MAG: D-glycero-beta-D-manno-heptose-7-phosphate kinase [Candidatus Lambdaproteobacteria bacterium]|nr:D-glycero-beta-D-manno-heptose-7-phosphate kinase [Candidatus Lambdaproteobacteria bacterium]